MMPKQYALKCFLLSFLVLMWSSHSVFSQPGPDDNINDPQFIPDANFRAAAEIFLGAAAGEAFSVSQANLATGDFIELQNSGITDMTGIEFFTSIDSLNASDNNISTIDLSQNKQLQLIDLSNNNLANFEISDASPLEILRLSGNNLSEITGLDIFNVPQLEELDISNNTFSEIDVSQLVLLRGLNIANNSFDTLTFSILNSGLKDLDISNNNFSTLDVSLLTNLEDLNASNNRFTSIGGDGDDLDLTGNPNLIMLDISNNADTSTTPTTPPTLDLTAIGSDFPALESKLTGLDVSDNNIATLDITNLRDLTKLIAANNNFDSGAATPFTLNTTFNPELIEVDLSGNELNSPNAAGFPNPDDPLNFIQNENIRILDLSDNNFVTAGTNVPDFLTFLLGQIDNGPNTNVTLEEFDFSRNVAAGAYTSDIDFSNNTALVKLNLSKLGTNVTADDLLITGAGPQTSTLDGLNSLEELDLSDNPTLFQAAAADGFSIFETGIDDVGTGSLRILNVRNTGIDTLLVEGGAGLTVAAGEFEISDPTTLEIINFSDNDLILAAEITAGAEFEQHTKNNGGTGARFVSLDFRECGFTDANNAVLVAFRNIYLIETVNRPNAQELEFDNVGQVTNGVAFLPVDDPSAGGSSLFSFQESPEPSIGIILVKPNGGEQFDSIAPNSNFPALAAAAAPNQSDGEIYVYTDSSIVSVGDAVVVQISTDGGATFTDLSIATNAEIQATDVVEALRATGPGNAIELFQEDFIDANGDPINSSQVVLRVSLANDPNLFDESDLNIVANKGSVIQNIFTGLSVSLPTGLFVDPKGLTSQVEVDVNVSAPAGIDSYVLQFRYDPDIFFYTEDNVITTGTASSTFPDPVVTFNNQTGTLTIAAASVNPIPNSPLIPNSLIKFRLNAFSFAQTGLSSDIEIVSAIARINEQPVQVTNSSIFVVNTFNYGDVNGDVGIGVLDANEILRFVAFAVDSFTGFPNIIRPDFPGAADVNDDGVVGAGDAALVLRFVAGVITTFPADTNGDGIGPDPINPNAVKSLIRNTNLLTTTDGNYINFSLSDTSDVYSFRLVLNYDPSELSLSDEDVYWLANINEIMYVNHDSDKGKVIIVGATINDLPGGPGNLVGLNFQPLTDEPGKIEIDLSQSNINDGAISLSTQSDSVVHINGSTGVPSWMIY